jgi:hypothetical protein
MKSLLRILGLILGAGLAVSLVIAASFLLPMPGLPHFVDCQSAPTLEAIHKGNTRSQALHNISAMEKLLPFPSINSADGKVQLALQKNAVLFGAARDKVLTLGLSLGEISPDHCVGVVAYNQRTGRFGAILAKDIKEAELVPDLDWSQIEVYRLLQADSFEWLKNQISSQGWKLVNP